MVSVFGYVCLPEAVRIRPNEPDECPLLSGFVWVCDEAVVFEDCVCGSAAYFDVFLLVEVCGDGFVAPSFLLPDLDDAANRCLRKAVDGVGSPRRVYQPLPSFPLEPRPPVMNRAFGYPRMF